jgi:hypothetical protein
VGRSYLCLRLNAATESWSVHTRYPRVGRGVQAPVGS